MRISYATMLMLAHAGYEPAIRAKEDYWTLLAFCTRPITLTITSDTKSDSIYVEAEFSTEYESFNRIPAAA
jgi:hypothetical protein